MNIEHYSFGKIIIDGNTYHQDLIIYPDRIDPSWTLAGENTLMVDDILDILREEPEILIIGTGFHGGLIVPELVKTQLMRQGINLMATKTEQAVRFYNTIMHDQKTIAAFHLTS
jgi:hypothetical protein